MSCVKFHQNIKYILTEAEKISNGAAVRYHYRSVEEEEMIEWSHLKRSSKTSNEQKWSQSLYAHV